MIGTVFMIETDCLFSRRTLSLGIKMAQSKFEYTRKFETDDKLVRKKTPPL